MSTLSIFDDLPPGWPAATHRRKGGTWAILQLRSLAFMHRVNNLHNARVPAGCRNCCLPKALDANICEPARPPKIIRPCIIASAQWYGMAASSVLNYPRELTTNWYGKPLRNARKEDWA